MLREEDKVEIKKQFEQLKDNVKILFFTQKVAGACQYCTETEQLLKEVAELSDKVEMTVYNFVSDKEMVEKYKIDKIPATVIMSKEDVGIRFYGIPSGYEFATFLQTLISVSNDEVGMGDDMKAKLESLHDLVHIQVFVTPTCPYCTRAAVTAYQLAMQSDKITADVVEVSEFPHLGQKYGVMGVPKVVLNEDHSFEGALPEPNFVEHVMEAAEPAQVSK